MWYKTLQNVQGLCSLHVLLSIDLYFTEKQKKREGNSKTSSKHPVCVPAQSVATIKPIVKHIISSHEEGMKEHHWCLFCLQYWEFVRNHFQIDRALFYCRKLQQNKHSHTQKCLAHPIRIKFLLELNLVIC